jgi:hypothetical protein
MAKLIYNQDLNSIYPAPEDGRELKSYEHVVHCPSCDRQWIQDLTAMRVFPPFSCGEYEANIAEREGCGYMFDLDEVRASVASRV